ncbi:alpha/beta hydrolase [Streptomyces ferrugineus]|uniref:Alpha/beta hydrolase n=1 Tax=Streptomyces ferrugineus TaxID=1413221 RepID=A0A7M2SG23_9ACTN|nr:alpha/beta hydrolase [Streptomyces ferrugineus]QOV34735.1 alpha/beta hydrolase [Streptomyces ferrugineus]
MSAKGPGAQMIRARSVVVDGARMACWESGPADGEPVLLLHGYPADHRCWRHQIPALARRYRVIAPDLLGWGESERPLHLRFDYDTEVARVGRLLDALGIDAVNLFGHDYGGFLALGLTQAHPDRVRRLAILNSRAQSSFVPRWYAVFGLLTLAGRTPGLRALAARLPLAGLHRRSLGVLVRGGHFDEELLDSHVDWMDTPEGRRWLVHFFGDYRVPARPELRRRLGDIRCPTAIVWGRGDTYLSSSIAVELAERVPHAELTMFDDAGHWVMDQCPAHVTVALERLLAREP